MLYFVETGPGFFQYGSREKRKSFFATDSISYVNFNLNNYIILTNICIFALMAHQVVVKSCETFFLLCFP